MKKVIGIFSFLVGLVVLVFISWLTGYSLVATVAAIIMLLIIAAFIYEGTGSIIIPSTVDVLLGCAITLCALVIIVMTISAFWKSYKLRVKEDEKQMANAAVCKNDNGDWVNIPSGFHKDSDTGECSDEPVKAPAATPVVPEKPVLGVIHTTPEIIKNLDFEFTFESEAPINIEYPGEEPIPYIPGKPITLPQPKYYGSKKFFDPKGGQVKFWICKGSGPCPRPV